MSNMENQNWNIVELHQAYTNKIVSPVEIIEWFYERIDQQNKQLNAYITVCYKQAMMEAIRLEKQIMNGCQIGLLSGIPISVKDLIFTKNIKTTMGSGVFKDFVPSFDAEVIKTLKQHGVIIMGKTNMHELAYGTTSDDSYFGPCKNPYDLTKISGGSSGGSAVAVSSGLCVGALGTDTSGSIRIPASCCGVVGMKPTYGRINVDGIYPLSWSMDHVGPMTRNVTDNAIIYSVLVGDPTFSQVEKLDLKDVVLGLPTAYFFDDLEGDVRESITKAIQLMESLGVAIESVHTPEMKKVMEISSAIDRSEAYFINQEVALDEHNSLGNETRSRILKGADIRAYEFLYAQKVKEELSLSFNKIFETVPFIVTPTIPILPTNIGEAFVTIDQRKVEVRSELMKFTFLANYLGNPAITFPCGFSKTGLPVGIQIMGQKNDEAGLYKVAYMLEQALDL
ncbi:amidase [Terrihalobacillus insolitus]|uniref:amidase n=1 Tax=Terrihalobacillus insolitus TaxID=2950438 RepID=UPI0023426402|nr:amidase [Terrihalobacillus insolitus]MDC3412119.1 amidase [Terrihalobacillus insolitus]